MPINLRGRSLLTLKDFTPDEIKYLLDLSKDLKAKKDGAIWRIIKRKNIVLIFEKLQLERDVPLKLLLMTKALM